MSATSDVPSLIFTGTPVWMITGCSWPKQSAPATVPNIRTKDASFIVAPMESGEETPRYGPTESRPRAAVSRRRDLASADIRSARQEILDRPGLPLLHHNLRPDNIVSF